MGKRMMLYVIVGDGTPLIVVDDEAIAENTIERYESGEIQGTMEEYDFEESEGGIAAAAFINGYEGDNLYYEGINFEFGDLDREYTTGNGDVLIGADIERLYDKFNEALEPNDDEDWIDDESDEEDEDTSNGKTYYDEDDDDYDDDYDDYDGYGSGDDDY